MITKSNASLGFFWSTSRRWSMWWRRIICRITWRRWWRRSCCSRWLLIIGTVLGWNLLIGIVIFLRKLVIMSGRNICWCRFLCFIRVLGVIAVIWNRQLGWFVIRLFGTVRKSKLIKSGSEQDDDLSSSRRPELVSFGSYFIPNEDCFFCFHRYIACFIDPL